MKTFLLLIHLLVFTIEPCLAQWNQLGSGMNTINENKTDLYDIVADTSGNVYVSTHDITGSYGMIFKWDGTTWNELGNHTQLNDLLLPILTTDKSGTLYTAGGYYPSNTEHVYKWSGTTWTELGDGSAFNITTSTINALTTDSKGNVYAAGCFKNSNGENYVAKWDGTSWSEVGMGANSAFTYGCIDAMEIDAMDSLYISGAYNHLMEVYVSKWNGAEWKKVGGNSSNFPGKTRVLKSDFNNNSIYVAGSIHSPVEYPYMAKWDGTSWTKVGPGDNPFNASNSVYQTLKIGINSSGNIYTPGYFNGGDSPENSPWYVNMFDGNTWKEFSGDPNYNFNRGLFIDKNDNVYATVADTVTKERSKFFVLKCDGRSVGISGDKILKPVLQIYPNPVTSVVRIDFITKNGNAEIELYNLIGEKILGRNISSSDKSVSEQFDLSNYPPGIYFISVKTDHEIFTGKIVKQ